MVRQCGCTVPRYAWGANSARPSTRSAPDRRYHLAPHGSPSHPLRRSPASSVRVQVAHCSKGDFEACILDCTEALTLNPNYDNAYHNRAVAYNNRGMYDECIADCNNATALNPYFDKAYFNRGFAYNSKGMYDNAVEDFTQASSLAPRYLLGALLPANRAKLSHRQTGISLIGLVRDRDFGPKPCILGQVPVFCGLGHNQPLGGCLHAAPPCHPKPESVTGQAAGS